MNPGRRSAYPTVVLFTGLAFVCALDKFVVGALLSLYKEELGLTDTQTGWVALAFMVSYVSVVPYFGWRGDGRARKPIMLGGLLLWSCSSLLSGFSDGLIFLLATRVLVGAGEGAFQSLVPSWLADSLPEKLRTTTFSVYATASVLGYMAAFVAGGTIAQYVGWRNVFFISGVPGLLLLVFFLRLEEPSRLVAQGTLHVPPTLRDLRALIVDIDYILYLIGYSLYLFGIGGLSFWGAAYLHRAFGIDNRSATTFFGLGYALPGVAGTLLGGYVAAQWRKYFKGAYVVCLIISAPLTITTLVFALCSTNISQAYIWFWIEILFSTIGLSFPLPMLLDLVPANLRGTAQAIFLSFSLIVSTALQTEVIGRASDSWGLRTALFLVPAGFALSLVVWLSLFWRQCSSIDCVRECSK